MRSGICDGLTMMGNTTVGGFLCNNMGNMVVAYFGNYGGGFNNEDENLDLLWGLRIARAQGINKMAIEGDFILITKDAKGEAWRN